MPNAQLRRVAHKMFFKIDGLYLEGDLIGVFGERTNEHGHAEPALDDDTWDAVDRATPILDERFAAWIKK